MLRYLNVSEPPPPQSPRTKKKAKQKTPPKKPKPNFFLCTFLFHPLLSFAFYNLNKPVIKFAVMKETCVKETTFLKYTTKYILLTSSFQ